jgi:hypothetical protein
MKEETNKYQSYDEKQARKNHRAEVARLKASMNTEAKAMAKAEVAKARKASRRVN